MPSAPHSTLPAHGYSWVHLLVDVGKLLDARGVRRRGYHDLESTRRIKAAASELLAALGVEDGQR
jgi:hypothetical protein